MAESAQKSIWLWVGLAALATAVGAGLLGALCGTAWKSLGGDAFYVLAWLYLSCAAMVAEVTTTFRSGRRGRIWRK